MFSVAMCQRLAEQVIGMYFVSLRVGHALAGQRKLPLVADLAGRGISGAGNIPWRNTHMHA